MQSGLPWGVNDTTTDFSGTGAGTAQNSDGERWNFFGNPADFKTSKALINTNGGEGGIPYFPGTSNADCLAKARAAGPLGVASLTNLGCYAAGNSILVPPAFGSYGTLGRNVFRSLPYYNWDLSVTKAWKFQDRLTAQFRAEFFNILNHPNISNPFGGPGGDNSLYRSFGDCRCKFRLPSRNTGRHKFKPRARVGRTARNPVGPEDHLLANDLVARELGVRRRSTKAASMSQRRNGARARSARFSGPSRISSGGRPDSRS